MEWSGRTARAVHPNTTCMTTNKNNAVRESEKSTGPAKAGAGWSEVFLGIDTSATKQAVTQFIPGEGAKPAEAMSTETLLGKVAKWVKAGVAVHCVYEAGPTGFGLHRQLMEHGATHARHSERDPRALDRSR